MKPTAEAEAPRDLFHGGNAQGTAHGRHGEQICESLNSLLCLSTSAAVHKTLLTRPLRQVTNGALLQARESAHSSQEQLFGSLAEG